MIKNIIHYSVKNKAVISLFMLAWVGWGIWSLNNLAIDAIPDITDNQVRVITTAPALATQEIEQFITYPVELAMANLPGVDEIRSISQMGLSVVTIVFNDNMGTYRPRQLVSEQLTLIQDDVPAEFGSPEMAPITTGLGEVYQYTLVVDEAYREQYSLTDLRTIQDWIVRRQLSGIEGVIEINSEGGFVRQYEVAINPEQLVSMNLTMTDILSALEMNNRNTGGSYVERGPEAIFIRGEGLAESLEDLNNIVVTIQGGMPVLIRDVANVRFGKAVRMGALTRNGQEVVGGHVLMMKGENSANVIEHVKTRIEEVRASLPEGVNIEPFIDRSRLIDQTISTVSENLIVAALIVIIVVVFLLGNIRSGLIVASVIPLSMLFAIGMMNLFDVSANLMSLGAIDFGIIIGGGVILVEFTSYLINSKSSELRKLNKKDLAKRVDELSIESGGRMMSSAFFGQIIVLIVFIPVMTFTGVEGKMFHPMAFTFVFAMIGAIILCLTYVPAASAFFLKTSATGKGELQFSHTVMNGLTYRVYRPTLFFVLRNKGMVILLAVALFVVSLFLFTRMGGEFIPQLDEGDIAIQPITKPGTSLSRTIENTTHIERILVDNFPEVREVVSRIGTAEVPTDPMSLDAADMFVVLEDRSEWTRVNTKEELIEMMREELAVIPGIDLSFTQPIEMRFNELMTGIREDIAVKIYGDDLGILANLGDQARDLIAVLPGAADVNVEQITGMPQLKVRYNRQQLARYGVQVDTLNEIIQGAYAGSPAGVIYEGERRFDLVVRLDEPYVSDLESVRSLYVPVADGSHVPMEQLADIEYEEGPAQISRDDTRRRIVIGVNAGSQDIQSLVTEIQEQLENGMTLPPGYNITYGGQFENLQRALERLGVAVPFSLLLIFVLLYFSLKSVKYSLLIFTAIPFAAIGGILSLWLRGMPFSISAGVGFIVLFGIAVIDGIILVSYFDDLKKAGISNTHRRVVMGGQRRLRSVLLTASTDLFGFLPMAISTSAGAEVQQPLATVVIGGVISSTLLTLLVLPVLYSFIEDRNFNFTFNRGRTAAIAGILVCVLAIPAISYSQAQVTLQTISQEEAVERAMSQYPGIRADRLAADYEAAIARTGYELLPAELFYSEEEYGEGVVGVQSFGIRQAFEFPFTSIRKSQVGRSQANLAEARFNLTQSEFARDVRKAWQHWRYSVEYATLQTERTRILETSVRAAQLLLETGDSDLLEKISAESAYDLALMQLEGAKNDAVIAEQKLKSFLLMEAGLDTTGLSFEALKWQYPEADTPTHSLVEISERVRVLRERETALNRSQFWPELFAGYRWQRLAGDSGFYAWEAGIRLPIPMGAETREFKAARINERAAEAGLQHTRLQFQNAYAEALQNVERWQRQYDVLKSRYEEVAGELIRISSSRFESGDISYLEYVRYIEQATQIEEEYLNATLKLNEAIIDLRFYLESE